MPVYKYSLKGGKTRWYASFYIVDWTGERKRVVKRGFRTQREAKEYERSACASRPGSAGILFSDLVDAYMDDMRHRLKPTTIETKRAIIETKIMPYFRRLRVRDIDAIAVRSWQNEMLSYRDKNGDPYSETYLKTINSQLSAVMNYAVRHYGISENPCHAAGSIGRSRADEMEIWTKDEYEAFAAAEPKAGYRLAFDILFYTGMRSGEMLALTPSDFLPERRIRISKTFAVVKGEELILEPKTPKAAREISIPEFLYREAEEYIGTLYGIQPDDRIFWFTKSGLTAEFKRRTKEAGLKEIRLHDLRHSHASMLIEMGEPILEISERLGHESVKTTLDTYAHLYPEKDRRLAEALDRLRDGKDAGSGTNPA